MAAFLDAAARFGMIKRTPGLAEDWELKVEMLLYAGVSCQHRKGLGNEDPGGGENLCFIS